MLPSYNVVMVCTVLKPFSPDLMELATLFCPITQTYNNYTVDSNLDTDQHNIDYKIIWNILASATSSCANHTHKQCLSLRVYYDLRSRIFIKSSDGDIPFF